MSAVTSLRQAPSNWRGAWYVAEYRLRNMWKWKGAVVAFGIGNPILYLASIGLGVGALVDANLGSSGVSGVPYLVFLAPALLATAALQGGGDEATFPTLSGFIWQKLFVSMRATTLTGGQIADGVLIAAMIRVSFTTVVYWLVLLAFGAVEIGSAVTLIPVALLAGASWAAVMLAITSYVKTDDGFLAIMWRFVLTPMFLFSGTFYPLVVLPLAVRWIGWVSPLWHATQLGRTLSYGAPSPMWLTLLSAGYLVALCVIGIVVARRQFECRLIS